jgi:sec-independent protein translocase protein TatA
MGPVGLPELAVIFVVALVLFGPKKLPELGRMLGTAISHYRGVRSEMKAAFGRELQNLERQARSQREIDIGHRYDNRNYDYSSGGASVGAELLAASGAESRDSMISGVYTTEEPARPTGGAHEAGIGVISHEA